MSTAADRTHPPRLAAPPTPRLPRLESRTLANGLGLHVAPIHKSPVVDVTLLVHAGAVLDPADRPGLATFAAAMLDEGAGARTALEIADAVEQLGAVLTTVAGPEMAHLNLHVPVARLDLAIELLADVALAPTFPEAEVERQRDLRRAHLLQLHDQPAAIAPIAFNAVVYGDHPYGRPFGGTEASTERLDRLQVQSFYAASYRPRHADLLVVGDCTVGRALERIAPRFAAWPDGEVPALPDPVPPPSRPCAIFVVDKPGAPQSVIRVGHVGVPRGTADDAAVRVMNTVLGGSFTSRLNRNLRETHGFTYGASSAFEMRRLAGPFRAGASVETAVTAAAVAEFLRELRRIRDEAITPTELEQAQRYLTLRLPGDFETTASAAHQFVDLIANDLPGDAWEHYAERVDAVTIAEVQRIARATIDPEHAVVLVVGDLKSVAPSLEALGEGPVIECDLWGNEKR